MPRILILLPFTIMILGCANPYSESYNDLTGGQNILENSQYVISTGEPKLIHGSEIEKDRVAMFEEGYVLLGFSSFESNIIDQDDALKHAKKIHACTVIVYSEHTNTVSGSTPTYVPNTQTSYHSGTVYGSRGSYANYSGTSTTYGSSITYIPYTVPIYDYYASFWAKTKPPRLGACIEDLTDEHRKKVESNKGVYIFAVVKGSPAFESDLLSGDVICRINGQKIKDSDHFMKMMDRISNPVMELEIFRNGKPINIKVELRS